MDCEAYRESSQESMKPKDAKWFRNKIDEARRNYVKQRDKDWREKGHCISCGVYREINELQIGHYYSRIHDYTTALGLREENVQLQCVPCNNYKRGNLQSYANGLVRKYGVQILERLEQAKKTPKKYKVAELQALLESYKEKLSKL